MAWIVIFPIILSYIVTVLPLVERLGQVDLLEKFECLLVKSNPISQRVLLVDNEKLDIRVPNRGCVADYGLS